MSRITLVVYDVLDSYGRTVLVTPCPSIASRAVAASNSWLQLDVRFVTPSQPHAPAAAPADAKPADKP